VIVKNISIFRIFEQEETTVAQRLLAADQLLIKSERYAPTNGIGSGNEVSLPGLAAVNNIMLNLAARATVFAITRPYITGLVGLAINVVIPEEFHNALEGVGIGRVSGGATCRGRHSKSDQKTVCWLCHQQTAHGRPQ
jgi:hypothetical protein